MLYISLRKTPNQQVGTVIDGVSYTLNFRTTAHGILLVDLTVGSELLFSSQRCVANSLVIPYPYLTNGGNFYFLCTDNEYPDFNKFNDAHILLYLTDEEIAANEF